MRFSSDFMTTAGWHLVEVEPPEIMPGGVNVFAFSGIGMLITRFTKEAESAHAAANGVMFPMMFLSGTFFPFEVMPDFLQAIAKFLPLYYINEGMRASMISLDGDIIIYNLLVILVVAIVIFVLGVLLTSWKED